MRGDVARYQVVVWCGMLIATKLQRSSHGESLVENIGIELLL